MVLDKLTVDLLLYESIPVLANSLPEKERTILAIISPRKRSKTAPISFGKAEPNCEDRPARASLI